MANIIIDELLCFVQNNCSKIPNNNMVSVTAGFYTDEEIVNSKASIYKLINGIHVATQYESEPPHKKTRRAGDCKRRLDMEDITAAFGWADSVLAELPTFVASCLCCFVVNVHDNKHQCICCQHQFTA